MTEAQWREETNKLASNPDILNHPMLRWERPILFLPEEGPDMPESWYGDPRLKKYAVDYWAWKNNPSTSTLDAFVNSVNAVSDAYKSRSGVQLNPEQKTAYAKWLSDEQTKRYGRPGAWYESPIITPKGTPYTPTAPPIKIFGSLPNYTAPSTATTTNTATTAPSNPVTPMLNTRPNYTPSAMGSSNLAQSYSQRFQPNYSQFPNYYPNRPNPFRNRQSIF